MYMHQPETTDPTPEKPRYRYYVRQGFKGKPIFEILDTTTQRVVKQGLDAHVIEHQAMILNLMDMYERLTQVESKLNELTGFNHR
jgi:hypothetical protein